MKSGGNRWGVTLHLLVEALGGHTIKSRQVRVEHDVVPAQPDDRAFDPLDRN